MAIPSRIRSIDGDFAVVECFGVERTVNLMLLPEAVIPGDYVIIQSGSFAVEKVDPDAALEALEYLSRVLGETGESGPEAALSRG